MKCNRIIIIIALCICMNVGIFSQDIVYERVIANEEISDTEFQRIKNMVRKAELFRGSEMNNYYYLFRVIDTIDSKVKSDDLVKVNVKNMPKENRRYSLVELQSGSSKGNLILQKDNNMWFYKPGTANALRISPTQRLLGGASYTDVSSTNYTLYYDPSAIKEITVGKTEAYQITLKQIMKGVSYDTIEFYITKDKYKPIKSEFYTRSQRLIKTMYFREYKQIKGFGLLTTEWVIVDGIKPNLITRIVIQEMGVETLNDRLYTSEGLTGK